VHRAGQEARAAVELARRSLASLIAAKPREIVLTGSGTESINLAIRGVLAANPGKGLVTTTIEHEAVRDPAEQLERDGTAVRRIDPGSDGVVRAEDVIEQIEGGAALVSVMHANNETGAIQPIEQIGAACRERGVVFHTDATQWVGKVPIDVSDMPIDLLTFSPHKFGGPKGVGVLFARRGVRFRPVTPGAQELGRRGGTENTAGIIGAGVAADEAAAWLADGAGRQRGAALRDRLESAILESCPGAAVNGPADPGARLWNTTNIGFPRLEAEALLLLLSERGLAASAGAACSSGSLDPSPVLLAMGVAPELAHGSVRFSLGRETTEDEIDRAAEIVAACVRRLGGSSAAL